MSTGAREKSRRLFEMYQDSLERRIQQGDWNPVCRDEDLYKDVEGLLSKGTLLCLDIHSLVGLDPLSVMEASLQALPVTSGQTGLERLAKAFEVLELAALNLYLRPWRKEYRVVKLFSGMFTHYIKPALTLQQAAALFGLLGYEPGGAGEDEQLKLSSRAVHADSLLQLAYAFFAVRVECRLLLCAVASLDHGAEGELQLVQERKHGHSLQVALQRARRKLESTPPTSNHDLSNLDAADLYTDESPEHALQPESDHMTEPPNYPYVPPEETLFSLRTSHGSCSPSERVRDENSGKVQALCVSTMTHQISPKPHLSPTQTSESSQNPTKTSDNDNQVTAVGSQIGATRAGQQVCSCFKSCDSYAHQCMQCREVHSMDCLRFRVCREQGHDVQHVLQHREKGSTQDHAQGWEKPAKDALKTHSCMAISMADVFMVCHNCHDIHDFSCDDLKRCQSLRHNVQATGKLQIPKGERGVTASPERHSCLSLGDPVCVVCHTCNKSHDYLCKETSVCQRSDHVVKYQVELDKGEPYTHPKPMPLHNCCASTKPDFACLTCRVFHAFPCNDQCLRTHEIQELSHACSKCGDVELHNLCRYCCIQYCRKCWYKNPLNCMCGAHFDFSCV